MNYTIGEIEPPADRITELENTNRLLCRDLDEAQKAIEVLRGAGIHRERRGTMRIPKARESVCQELIIGVAA